MNHYHTTELQFPLASQEIRLLAELGFIAAASGQVVTATTIFDALIRLRSKKAFPYVGKAVALLYVGSIPSAIELLSRASKVVETDQEQIWIYLALAFQCMGDVGKARKILDYLLNSGELSEVDVIFAKAILKSEKNSGSEQPIPFPITAVESDYRCAIAK
jgi:predicted Zn-dependent protease